MCYGLCCVCVHCVHIVRCMYYLCGVCIHVCYIYISVYSLYVYCACCLRMLTINKHDPWGRNRRYGRKGMLEMEKMRGESWEGRRQGWAHWEQG